MYAKEILAMHLAFDEFWHNLQRSKKPIIVITDNKALTRFFQSKLTLHHCENSVTKRSYLILCYLMFRLLNPTADSLSRLIFQPEDRAQLNSIDSIPVFQVQVDIASKKPKKEEDDTHYYPYDGADENIWEHGSTTPDDRPWGETQHKHSTSTENVVHQMESGDNGHRRTSMEN